MPVGASNERNLGLIEDHYNARKTLLTGRAQAVPAVTSWDSAWQDRLAWRRIQGFITSDQGGSVMIDHAVEGTTVDYMEVIPLLAGTPLALDRPILGPRFRVRVGNNAAAAASMTGHIEAVQG